MCVDKIEGRCLPVPGSHDPPLGPYVTHDGPWAGYWHLRQGLDIPFILLPAPIYQLNSRVVGINMEGGLSFTNVISTMLFLHQYGYVFVVLSRF